MRFTHAIVSPPATTFAAGITTSGCGPPDLTLALEQHETYCRALEGLGLSLMRLAPDPAFPDGTFVEDAAIVTHRGALLTRPGAASRAGDGDGARYGARAVLPRVGSHHRARHAGRRRRMRGRLALLHRLSDRTNADGAAQLAAWLGARGFRSTTLDIRGVPRLLHLKTGLAWLGGKRLLASSDVAGHEALAGWDVVRVPPGEEYAANSIRVNDSVLVAEGFPATRTLLADLGYRVVPLPMSEFRKMDGGLSCLSVRW